MQQLKISFFFDIKPLKKHCYFEKKFLTGGQVPPPNHYKIIFCPPTPSKSPSCASVLFISEVSFSVSFGDIFLSANTIRPLTQIIHINSQQLNVQ